MNILNTIIHLSNHITASSDALQDVRSLPFYRSAYMATDAAAEHDIARLLNTSWATEYALRARFELHDDEFLANSFDWTLLQAFHAVLPGLQAFIHTLGVRSNNRALLMREAGRLVVKNAYPRSLSFHAAGGYGDFNVYRLPYYGYPVSVMFEDSPNIGIQTQIALALQASRKAAAIKIRAEVQANPLAAIRNQETGKPVAKFTAEHWQQLTWRMGYTAWPNLLADLRLANIESLPANFDVRPFYSALLHVVSYVNCVHEQYIAKAMGHAAYSRLINSLPEHLMHTFPAERFQLFTDK